MKWSLADLLQSVDPSLFLSKFGVGVEEAQSLLEAKVGSISQLLYFLISL